MSAPQRFACALIVLAACNHPLTAQQGRRGEGGERIALRPEEIAQGRELYNRNCTMCHGLDGAAGDRAPALGATRRYLRRTEQELFDAIKNGIPGTLMPSSPLNPPEVRLIVAYIRGLRATAADVAVPGNPDGGRIHFSRQSRLRSVPHH
jgi:mono/diheme cytochrome c family protein